MPEYINEDKKNNRKQSQVPESKQSRQKKAFEKISRLAINKQTNAETKKKSREHAYLRSLYE